MEHTMEINASTYVTQQQKLSKMGHNSAKIWRMITNIELDLYFTIDINFRRLWMKSMHPFKSYWSGNLTQQQKLSPNRAIAQPKFGGWLPISNLICILQWYKLLQTLNEINAALQK